jgi:hypothetical protein
MIFSLMLRPQRQMLFASSKLSIAFRVCARFCLLLLCFAPGIYTACASNDAHISVVSLEPARVRIEGKGQAARAIGLFVTLTLALLISAKNRKFIVDERQRRARYGEQTCVGRVSGERAVRAV